MRPFVYGVAVCCFLPAYGLALGRKPPPVPHFNAWLVYWDEARGQQALLASIKDLSEVSIFAYNFDGVGHVVPGDDEILSFKNDIPPSLLKPGPRFLYTVVNDRVTDAATTLKDPAIVHQVIGTPLARAAHIQELLALCAKVDGLEIDYERLDPADRDAFTQFIQALGKALHKRHQWLSVVVQPRTQDTKLTNQSGAAVIDWEAIISSVDELKEMAYMFHYETSAPGSIAPLSWLTRLVTYAKTIVPLSKLCIVLHLGGFDWPEHGTAHPIEFSEALALAAAHQVPVALDAETGSAHFSYPTPTGMHTVWIEDEEGVMRKTSALAAQGIRKVGFWRLGTGDSKLWEAISKK